MNCLVLSALALLTGNGLVQLAVFGPWTAAPQSYQVDVKLVEVQPNGHRNVTELPRLSVATNRPCEVDGFSEEQEHKNAEIYQHTYRAVCQSGPQCPRSHCRDFVNDSSWSIRLANSLNSDVRVDVSVEKVVQPGTFQNHVLQPGQAYRLETRVIPGKINRHVLTRDHEGLPTSWIELIVNRPENRSTSQHESPESSDSQGSYEEQEVHPSWFGPF